MTEKPQTAWELIQPLFDRHEAEVMGMNIVYHIHKTPILVELNGVKVGDIIKTDSGYKLVTLDAFGSLEIDCGESNEEKLKLSKAVNRVCGQYILGVIKL